MHLRTLSAVILLQILAACSPTAPKTDDVSDALSAPPAPTEAMETAVAARIGQLSISNVSVSPSRGGVDVVAGYLEVMNASAGADRLVSASSPSARAVEIHDHVMTEGKMSMVKMDNGFEVPAGGSLTLAPGGKHLMIFGSAAPLVEGGTIQLDLMFEKAGKVSVQFPVKATQGHGGHSGH
jgi:periplasmic copper chaperone A